MRDKGIRPVRAIGAVTPVRAERLGAIRRLGAVVPVGAEGRYSG